MQTFPLFEFASVKTNLMLPISFKNGNEVIKIRCKDEKLVMINQEAKEIVICQYEIEQLRGLWYKQNFFFAGKTKDKKWIAIKQILARQEVKTWSLCFHEQKYLNLIIQDPVDLYQTFQRGFSSKNKMEQLVCSICLQNLQVEDQEWLLTTFCNHTFHKNCLKQWGFSNTCPQCRQPMNRKKVKTVENSRET